MRLCSGTLPYHHIACLVPVHCRRLPAHFPAGSGQVDSKSSAFGRQENLLELYGRTHEGYIELLCGVKELQAIIFGGIHIFYIFELFITG